MNKVSFRMFCAAWTAGFILLAWSIAESAAAGREAIGQLRTCRAELTGAEVANAGLRAEAAALSAPPPVHEAPLPRWNKDPDDYTIEEFCDVFIASRATDPDEWSRCVKGQEP